MTRAQQPKDLGKRVTQKAETREKILISALNEFSERGFDGATIRDISASAGVQHGLIKYHFENKEQLWKASVDFLFKRMYDEMAEPDEDRTRSRNERVRRWIHRYVRYCAKHPEHARIMVQESMRDSDRLTWAADKYIKEQHKLMTDSLAVILDLARYPSIEISTLVYMLNAAMQAPFNLAAEIKHVHGTDISSDAFLDNYANGIFDLFYRPYLADEHK